MSSPKQTSLTKQIAGAVIGGALALIVYTVYTTLEPELQKLSGILITPQARLGLNPEGDVRIASTDVEEDRTIRVASKTKQIANQQNANSIAQAPVAMPAEFLPEDEQAPVDFIEDIEGAWEDLEAENEAMEAEMAWEENLEFQESEPDFYGETDQLPDSGIGTWIASLFALLGATYALRRKKLADCAANA